MASSYSTDLKLELMATGENAGTWGDNTNNNLNLIQQAIAGYEAVALSDGGTVALAMTDKTISNARNMVIKFTGTLTSASTVTIPNSIEKFYIFDCSAVVGPTNLTIKTASGTGFTLDRAAIYAAYADGTNLNEISLDTLGGKVAAAQLTPAGSDKQIQFNDNGSFGGIAIGTCGQVLTSDGTSASFQDAAGGGAVSWDTTAKTAGFTAVAGEGYFVNTTSGAVTVTLPSSPSAGDIVAISDYAQTSTTNAITVARNGENIQGSAADLTINKNGAAITLIYVDATKGWIVINTGNEDDAVGPKYVAATGGTVTCCGDFKIHTFTSPGTFCVTCAGNVCGSNSVDYLVVAGGGGGNSSIAGGGGGGGGFRYSSGTFCVPGCAPAFPLDVDSSIPISAGPNPVTVGGGGSGSPGQTPGSGSSFSTITSAGGGSNPLDGGSGAGRAHRGGAGGTGNTPPTTPPQGQNGGASPFNTYSGGGGGGATQAGQDAQPPMPAGPGGFGGAGGGLPNAFGTSGENCGSFYYFSGGGGGGGAGNSGGAGGLGGGGNGGHPVQAGTANTGGGGGGNSPSSPNSGVGGSGIVIIRYKYQ